MIFQSTLTARQVRELDRLAIENYGIRGLILMENAGAACAAEAIDMLGDAAGKAVGIFCGRGNNGGDGFVIARRLANAGARVNVLLAARVDEVLRRRDDASVNLDIALRMRLPVVEITDEQEAAGTASSFGRDSVLLVDALLGTGVRGEVRGVIRSLIDAINRLCKPALAVDLPSGLDCDTGEVLGSAVRCRRTVTFAAAKRGFLNPAAAEYTGEVTVADIGIPRVLLEEQYAVRESGAESCNS